MASPALTIKEMTQGSAEKHIDVIFIHGLEGADTKSWTTSEGSFWPKWIGDDFPEMRVAVLNYPSKFFKPKKDESDLTFEQRTDGILSFLRDNGYGERPIIFVAHSLGGIIVQAMLARALEHANDNWNCLGENTKGVILLGVPQQGDSLASIIKQFNASSKILEALCVNNDYLVKLRDGFKQYVQDTDCYVRCFAEGKKTYNLHLVPEDSANLDLNGNPIITLDEDHISISKLATREKEVYVASVTMLKHMQEKFIEPQKLKSLDDSIAQDQIAKYQKKIDRLSLAEKLTKGGRAYDIKKALRDKKDLAKAIASGANTKSGRSFYARLCGDVESRFNTIVPSMIHMGKDNIEVDTAIIDKVLTPIVKNAKDDGLPINDSLVRQAISYLTGHCHIRWHADE